VVKNVKGSTGPKNGSCERKICRKFKQSWSTVIISSLTVRWYSTSTSPTNIGMADLAHKITARNTSLVTFLYLRANLCFAIMNLFLIYTVCGHLGGENAVVRKKSQQNYELNLVFLFTTLVEFCNYEPLTASPNIMSLCSIFCL
jgi:hypothetical protein